ncbi:MAG: protein kinase [Gemmatimonadales bacterium]
MSFPTAGSIPTSLRDALAGKYTLERELGRGGMATVYLAHDQRHDRPVAIKVLHTNESIALGVERFEREIKVLARLRHPFILPLHDSGEAAGSLFFVMSYIDGESLRARLDREESLQLEQALRITQQIADALSYAHGENVVHRDVKPENILLSRHGHALLADFGIARGALLQSAADVNLTMEGMTVGTAGYMSPEQALAESDIDGRGDIYSLGCIVHEMLAGSPPFVGRNAISLIAQHVGAPAPSLESLVAGLPASVISAVSRTLAKEPGERFSTAADFVNALLADPHSAIQAMSGSARLVSIAVLPIVNTPSDERTEFFSDGITEELMNTLSKVEGLRVVSRTSAFAFKGRDTSVREIAAKLNVSFVLEASVRRAGSRLRMTSRLVDVKEDSTVWSETYERQLEDVFAVQDEITRSIVSTITGILELGHLRGETPVQQPRSLEAYDLYLLGRHHWYKRSEQEMKRALDFFQRAADADPSYAPAYSGIADASSLLASWQFDSPEAMYPKAAAAARRALELDSSSADAHASLGFVKQNWEWDWNGAVNEYHQSIALNPSHETAHRWLSAFLAGLGRHDEALPVALHAQELNPISVLPQMNLGIVKLLAGRYEEAAADFASVMERDPDFVRAYPFRSTALSFLARHDEAIKFAREGVERSNGLPVLLMALGSALAYAGLSEEARETLAKASRSGLPPIYQAMGSAALEDYSAALDALDRGYETHSDWMYSMPSQPWFRPMHSDPRFTQLLERMGLEPEQAPSVPV